MRQRIKNFIQKDHSELILAFLILMLITTSYLAYLKFIGIPMTKAHNLYSAAIISIEQGKLFDAKTKLEESLKLWNDPKVKALLDETMPTLSPTPSNSPG